MKTPMLLLLSLTLTVFASAAEVRLSATFTATPMDVNGSGQSYPFDGAFSYVYDSALIPTSGSFEIANVAPTSLTLDHPTIGAITYDLSNTTIEIDFLDGMPTIFELSDANQGLSSGTDDFWVLMLQPGAPAASAYYVMYILASDDRIFAIDFAPNASFSISSAPDATSTALLVGLSVFGLAISRLGWRKRNVG
jgi:hypothetical protein